MNEIQIGDRKIGLNHEPFIIAEIGINHEGDINKAKRMVEDAVKSGAECVKFQMHVIEDEMTSEAKKIIPENAKESIWDIMKRCALTKEQHIELKNYCEKLGVTYLCTPFSRAAADILNEMEVKAYKIGSGECNNYPLVEHIASFGKPIILSTGMNNIKNISKAVEILKKKKIQYAILHCTSMYPTPYEKVCLGAIKDLELHFPNTVLGLSDHSIGVYTSLAAIPLSARIIEKHFTSNKSWSGPDIPISIDTKELKELIFGSKAIYQALGGKKEILKEEKSTINFAYASVVSIKDIKKGEKFTKDNLWVKRPGTGEILAKDYKKVLGKKTKASILKGTQLRWNQID